MNAGAESAEMVLIPRPGLKPLLQVSGKAQHNAPGAKQQQLVPAGIDNVQQLIRPLQHTP